MGFTAADLPDLTGTHAVVTGANSGIGYVTALEFARHGAAVTLACRNTDKAAAAQARIRAEMPGAEVSVGALDLSRLESVRDFAGGWDGPLDLLVNNAGVMAPLQRRTTADGFERQMGTNHLGHFALTGLLLPALLAASHPRVVTVSSLAHSFGALDLDDLQSVAGYTPQRAYGNSKLANLMFAQELQRRAAAAGSNLVSTAAHPGLADTGLVTNPDGMGSSRMVRLLAPFNKVISQSAAAGARPTLYAATAAEPGSYTGPSRLRESRGAPGPATVSESAADPAVAGELWDISSELTGVTYSWVAPPPPPIGPRAAGRRVAGRRSPGRRVAGRADPPPVDCRGGA
jgi:NAD(P)-dependent dehydrogenase (short-subunit alcohol dehydrogenase family)